MNSIIIRPEERRSSSQVFLTDLRWASVQEAHGLKTGRLVRLVIPGESILEARVEGAGGFTITEELRTPQRMRVHLCLATPRPQTVKKALHIATTCGVKSITFVRSDRSEKNYLQSKSLEPSAIEQELDLGLQQAVDCVAPRVTVSHALDHFHQKIACLQQPNARIVFDTQHFESDSMTTLPQMFDGKEDVTLFFGPESGWSDREREMFRASNAFFAHLGPRILRVEVALSFALGWVSCYQDAPSSMRATENKSSLLLG